MRIVIWNMAANTTSKSRATHDRTWQYLAEMEPDVALIQEARPLDRPSLRDGWSIVHRPYRIWVSAVLAKAPLLLEPYEGTFEGVLDAEGYLATAAVTLPDGSDLLLGSVHTPIGPATESELAGRDPDEVRTHRYDVPYRRDMAYAIYRDRVAGRRFLVGGDWNTARLWDDLHPRSYEVDFFKRAQHDGWVDAYARFHPEGEGQTWFRGGDPPYQNDHVFCDKATAEALESVEIDRRPAEELGLSDHAPLMLALTL